MSRRRIPNIIRIYKSYNNGCNTRTQVYERIIQGYISCCNTRTRVTYSAKFERRDTILECSAAILERNATKIERNAAIPERKVAKSECNAAILERRYHFNIKMCLR